MDHKRHQYSSVGLLFISVFLFDIDRSLASKILTFFLGFFCPGSITSTKITSSPTLHIQFKGINNSWLGLKILKKDLHPGTTKPKIQFRLKSKTTSQTCPNNLPLKTLITCLSRSSAKEVSKQMVPLFLFILNIYAKSF